jgi:SAM-dependent methyltransferase
MNKRVDVQKHNQEVIEYYDNKIKKTMTPSGNLYTQHHLDKFLQFTGIKPGDRVLDVGCGMGRYTIPLAARGIKVEGLDISPFLLDRLKEYNNDRFAIPLYCMDILDHPQSMKGAYDAVIGTFALHHMHNLAPSFSAMAEVVKPGGQVAFLEPNAYNILYYLQIMVNPLMTWKGDRGMADMRPGVIFPAMKTAGLESLSLYRFGFFPPFITNQSWGIWLEMRLERFPLWRPLLPAAIFRGIRPV